MERPEQFYHTATLSCSPQFFVSKSTQLNSNSVFESHPTLFWWLQNFSPFHHISKLSGHQGPVSFHIFVSRLLCLILAINPPSTTNYFLFQQISMFHFYKFHTPLHSPFAGMGHLSRCFSYTCHLLDTIQSQPSTTQQADYPAFYHSTLQLSTQFAISTIWRKADHPLTRIWIFKISAVI